MGFSVSTATNPSYMYQSPSGYIFRLRIPNDLKRVAGKCEFRYSLRTGALRVAKHRARCIASYIQQLFIKVRSSMAEFTQEQITNLVQRYIRETLANDEKCRAISGPTADGTTTLEGMTLLESSDMKADEAESLLKSVNRWLKYQDHSLMKPVTEKLIDTQEADIVTESDTHQTLSRELLKAFQGVLKVRIKRSEGDYSLPDDELIPILKQQPKAISEVSVAQENTGRFCLNIRAINSSTTKRSYGTLVDSHHSLHTCQCPPFAGPSRCKKPFSLSIFR